MINGQLNMVSVPVATPPGTLETAVQVAVTMEDVPQKGGGFAELLSGIRLQAKETVLPDSGESETLQSNALLALNSGEDVQITELLTQLNGLSRITTASESDVKNPVDSEKTGVSADAVKVGSEPSEVTLQMALAAYFQSGRTPEVNTPSPGPVDRPQNAATVTETPAVIPAPVVKQHMEPVDSEATQAAPAPAPASELVTASTQPRQSEQVPATADNQQPAITAKAAPAAVAVVPIAPAPEAPLRMAEVNNPSPRPVDRPQNAAAVTEAPAVIPAPVVQQHIEPVDSETTHAAPALTVAQASAPASELVTAGTQPRQSEQVPAIADNQQPTITAKAAPAAVAVPPITPAPEAPLRTAEVNIPSTRPVDRLQNAAAVTEAPAVIPAPVVQQHMESVDSEATQAAPAPTAAQALAPASGLVTASTQSRQSEQVQKASEVEIQLSQPLPIIARATTVSSVAESNPDLQVAQTTGNAKRLVSEQQIEMARKGADPESTIVKEMTSSLEFAESAEGSMMNAENSDNSNSNQRQPDGASDTKMVQGLLGVERQNTAVVTAKEVPAEPVRQNIPEQILQQVKERLVQHDVKAGTQQITLTLSPEGLGELKMNLNLQGQKLSVEIVTENRTVRDAVVQHTDALKESLARQNITMESFDVTTGGKSSGNQGQNQNAWRELAKQQLQQQFLSSTRGYPAAQADLPSTQAAYQRQQGNSMLDIHY